MLPPKGRRDASAAEKGGLLGDHRQTGMEHAQDTASSPASEPTASSTTQPLTRSPDADTSSDFVPKNDLPVPFDCTGQIAPPGSSPKFTTAFWEDEGCLCYQVETRGVCVARRDDNHMINGTKLLTLTAMTAGRKGALLKSEKIRHTVKLGPTHFKGVWIPFERALELANAEKIVELLYPLFVHDIGSLARKTSDQKLTQQNESQLKSEEVKETAGSNKTRSAHSSLTKDDDQNPQPIALDTVQNVELQEPGILGSLFRSLTQTLGLIMKEVRSQSSEARHYNSLEATCAALLFWGNDLGLPQGKLDDKLQYSPHLRGTCITVLVSIARFVSTCLIGLVMTRMRQEQILQSSGILILLKHVTNNDQRQGFTYFPEKDAEMLCQALRTKIDTLIMLAPSLSSPTEEVSDEEELRAIQDVDETLTGEAFAERVAKMLPLAPPDIVARLGTLNWDRYNHILQLQREATQQENVTTTMEMVRNVSHKSGLGVSAMASSAVKVDKERIHEPYMLSASAEARHERAPSLPVRTCNICGKDVLFKTTTAWRKHIYNDFLAYTCFFPKCPDTRVFYEDAQGLMTHLKDRHGMDVRVYDVTCPLCIEFTTGDQDVLSLHIAHHMEEIAVSVLPSGLDPGEEAEDDLGTGAMTLKELWMLLEQRAIYPEESKDAKFGMKLEPSD